MVKENTMRQTEIGLLPEDWEVNSLKEICKDMIQGINTAIDIPEYSFEGVPILKANNVIDGQIDLNNCEFISEKSFRKYSTRFHISKNDFLLSNIGARLGSGSIYLTDAVSVYAWNVMRLSPKKDIVNPHYFSQILNSSYFNKLMINNQSGSGMGFVPKNVLQTFQIPLPPLPEQEVIAKALSDADAWIESLEQLIAKKCLIKQGAMQELLSPAADWEVKRLGEVCEIIMGQSPLSQFYNNSGKGLPLVQGNADIENRRTIIRNYTSQITKRGKIGDIIMSVRAPVGEIATATFDCCLGRGVCAFRTENKFIYHLLIYKETDWAQFSTGSTFDSVNSNQIKDLEVNIPKSLTEQTRIATILSDMDAELEALEVQLGKARQVKQGMMQELLTGRVRLI
ncbi:restriction endonuclease subunit S [Chryseobacterium sp. OV279]|uniref:restriction endonuclease subunit S n=1 Tax=Chryseobacterium sp. OV279 TaxID=1500285 RepID=UPI000922ABE2|nr:restriction endonuclease subunit S [Chryseobacterium sp. OV279]SHE93389.1 type I restriction enzyme, S subunit [Chryseobacterium sp. OV279]